MTATTLASSGYTHMNADIVCCDAFLGYWIQTNHTIGIGMIGMILSLIFSLSFVFSLGTIINSSAGAWHKSSHISPLIISSGSLGTATFSETNHRVHRGLTFSGCRFMILYTSGCHPKLGSLRRKRSFQLQVLEM